MQRPIAAPHHLLWDDVRVFLAVSRTTGLRDAGRQLDVDKATVSRRLAALEKSLGSRLFLRVRDGLRLTPAGERLVPHAEAMEAAARGVVGAAVTSKDEVRGIVRVATTEAFATFLVERGLLDLATPHPGLALELLGGNQVVDLERGEAELALRLTPPGQGTAKVRIAARLGLSLYASPAYLKRRGVPIRADALEGHDVILPSGELTRLPEARWLASLAGTRVSFRSSSMPALVAAARRGHGLLVLTRAWGNREEGLTRVLDLPQFPARPVWLVAGPDVLDRPAVRLVADRLMALLKDAAAEPDRPGFVGA